MLKSFIQEREGKPPAGDFGTFERDLRSKMAEIERDLVAEELERLDVDAPVVLIDGVPHRRVLRCEETYLSAAGPVRVERTLYSTRRDGERAVSALELRAGIVENYWTPLAAEQAVFMVAHNDASGERGAVREARPHATVEEQSRPTPEATQR
ncbi:hypothetical protein ACMHYB_45040 [Sorangium sp. So ce1128]